MSLSEINRTRKDLFYLWKMGASFETLKVFLKSRMSKAAFKKQAALREGEFQKFIASRSFSNDWFSGKIYIWHSLERYLKFSDIQKIVEIGSWQGMSTNFLALNFPNATIDCVDTWAGADEHTSGDAASAETLAAVEDTFDLNITDFSDRVQKHKMPSFDFLKALHPCEKYDLIYIDGSHDADDVIIDAFLSFSALENGGLLIFDDYLWRYYRDKKRNPASAINFFLRQKADDLSVLFIDSQVVVRKNLQAGP